MCYQYPEQNNRGSFYSVKKYHQYRTFDASFLGNCSYTVPRIKTQHKVWKIGAFSHGSLMKRTFTAEPETSKMGKI